MPLSMPAVATDPPLAYSVTACVPDQVTAERYIAWLTGDHVAKVLAGGATTAEIVVLDGAPVRIQTRYVFPNRAALEAYMKNHAPALRGESALVFPAESGVTFERQVGKVVQQLTRGGG